MSTIIHIPENFTKNKKIEKLANDNNITIQHLVTGKKSFKIFGSDENINKFNESISEFTKDGIYMIKPIDRNKHFKSYIKKIKPLDKNLTDNINAYPYYTATQIANIYNLNTNPSSRINIAIIELGGGYQVSDLQTYWNVLQLNVKPNVYAISVDGISNSPGSDADSEVTLDIEVVGGICPNSNIYVYFAPITDSGFYNAIYTAIYNKSAPVTTISISWGGAENNWDINTLNTFNALFQQAAELGITICTAAGDNGSSDGETLGNYVDFPSASPWVLACGGTHLLSPNYIYDDKTSEVVWGNIPKDGATGGGISSVFTIPQYQITAATKYATTKRCVPDCAGNADPETGWIIYLNGTFSVIGGTSAVAPMWASYLASLKINKFINPILYELYKSNTSIFHDIIIGNDGTWEAQKGYDVTTGLGSPNGTYLTPLLKQYI